MEGGSCDGLVGKWLAENDFGEVEEYKEAMEVVGPGDGDITKNESISNERLRAVIGELNTVR